LNLFDYWPHLIEHGLRFEVNLAGDKPITFRVDAVSQAIEDLDFLVDGFEFGHTAPPVLRIFRVRFFFFPPARPARTAAASPSTQRKDFPLRHDFKPAADAFLKAITHQARKYGHGYTNLTGVECGVR
jgi:hypothetical protein